MTGSFKVGGIGGVIIGAFETEALLTVARALMVSCISSALENSDGRYMAAAERVSCFKVGS